MTFVCCPKRLWHRVCSYVFILGFVLSFVSFAQTSDAVLQSYGLAFENLNEASTSFEADAQQSIEALNDASQMLRPLSSSSSSNVIPALERTFERAKTSVQNQSPADLEVQIAVLKGGFWRLVYESAIEASTAGDLGVAKLRLAQLAQDMGLAETVTTEINSSDQAIAILTALELGIATRMQEELIAVRTLVESSADLGDTQALSYQRLANAYSLYLPVQDSTRSSSGLSASFNDAFVSLVASDTEVLLSNLETLTSLTSNFSSAALAANTGLQQEAAPTEVIISEAIPVETTVAAEAPANAATTEPVVSTPAIVPPVTTPTANAAAIQAAQTAELSEDQEALRRQLARLGLTGNQQDRLLSLYGEEGYSSINSVIDTLYADSAKTIVAVSQGDITRAKSLIGLQETTYQKYLQSILAQTNPSVDQTTTSMFRRLAAAPGLRLQDTVVLSEHIYSLAAVLSNNPVSALTRSEAATTVVWAGWLRLVLTILLGLLAFVPLYLLYLAFGGGNRNWQLIGWALFCLLLPLMYEGLAYFASLISSLAGGISFLDALSRFSIFQSTFSQILWVIVSAAAIALASLGLYGICVQFGLLGQRNKKQTVTISDTVVNPENPSTSFDWDEEF